MEVKMTDLKLAKLPDRKPVRITVTVRPELNAALQTYAELYREAYGEEETVQQLIPFMLESFLKADGGFAKARRQRMTRSPRAGAKPAGARLPGSETASRAL